MLVFICLSCSFLGGEPSSFSLFGVVEHLMGTNGIRAVMGNPVLFTGVSRRSTWLAGQCPGSPALLSFLWVSRRKHGELADFSTEPSHFVAGFGCVCVCFVDFKQDPGGGGCCGFQAESVLRWP